jgi:hypothetical protein
MQMPTWARLKTGQPATPKPSPSPAPAKPTKPTIRDDAWWLERMQEWRAKYPDRSMPRNRLYFWLALDVDQRPNDGDSTIPTNLDWLLDRLIEGETMVKLADYCTELLGYRISHATLRTAITATHGGAEKFAQAKQHIAHRLVEEALETAHLAGQAGDYRAAIDTKTKLAAKLNPGEYGDKTQLEIGGIRGGVPIESNVKQSPMDAYKAALGGGSL